MSSARTALGIGVLLALMAASRATSPVLPLVPRAMAPPGSSHLVAFGSRGVQPQEGIASGKLDSALADLARHAARVRPGHALQDLRALNPAARFRQSPSAAEPLVLVDAVTRGDAGRLKTALQRLGLQRSALYSNDVGGWLPLSQLEAAAAQPELHSLRAAMPHTYAGAVSSQGDFAQGSAALRSTYTNLTGAGVTVGVLSDSFNCYGVYEQLGSGIPASGFNGYARNGFRVDAATDQASGDLPTSLTVLEEADCLSYGAPDFLPFTDEGRAMLQIVHDVAPGAALAFYTAENSEADFAHGITALAAAGAKVEADDTGYFDEPFFQDGIVAQAVDTVESQGVAYFSAAGNNAQYSYENTAPSFSTLATSGSNSGEYLLNFDVSGTTMTTAFPVTIPGLFPGEYLAVIVEWDQPYVTGAAGSPGASSRIDLCVTGSTSADHITDLDGNPVSCTGPNATGADPVQLLIIGNPADASGDSAAESINVVIGLAGGTAIPGRIKLVLAADGAPLSFDSALATHSSTLQGHPGAAGAMAVGAAFFPETPRCGVSPALLESYSSQGGAPILFDNTGARLSPPITRQKPDIVGPDGVNTTFFGRTFASAGISDPSSVPQCLNDADYPSFFGTSAATPHVAGAAALMLQANAALAPAQIYGALRSSAQAMSTPVPNFESGYGFVQVDAALAQLPPAAPNLAVNTASVVLGGSATLSWSSINSSLCTATGDWSGTLATTGSAHVTPSAIGTASYTLTCANAVGSAHSTVTLSVVATAPASHSGGGGFGGGTLLLLAGVVCADRLRDKRSMPHPTAGLSHAPDRSDRAGYFLQRAMNVLHADRAFADGGCNAFDAARAHIARGEYARQTGLHRMRWTPQRPAGRRQILRIELGTGFDEAIRVEGHTVLQPWRVRHRAGHDEHMADRVLLAATVGAAVPADSFETIGALDGRDLRAGVQHDIRRLLDSTDQVIRHARGQSPRSDQQVHALAGSG